MANTNCTLNEKKPGAPKVACTKFSQGAQSDIRHPITIFTENSREKRNNDNVAMSSGSAPHMDAKNGRTHDANANKPSGGALVRSKSYRRTWHEYEMFCHHFMIG